MGFFKRLNDIVSANLNDMLDQMEEPEKMMKQLVREMESGVAKAKEALIKAIADERRIEKEIAGQKEKIEGWQERAIAAVEAEREELARKAIEMRKECQAILAALEPEVVSAGQASAAMRTQYRALVAKVQEAKRKQASLAARGKAAEMQKKAAGAAVKGKVSVDAFEEFDRLSGKVVQAEAEAQAATEVAADTRLGSADEKVIEDEFAQMEGDKEIDDELAALKAKAGKG